MKLLKEGKTNLKYILIVVILAIVVGGGILDYKRIVFEKIISLLKFPEIKKPEKVEIKKPEKVTIELDKCKDIEDPIDRDRCYTAQAIETRNEEYCKYITSDIKEDCWSYLAILENKPELCRDEGCLHDVFLQNTDLCKEIPIDVVKYNIVCIRTEFKPYLNLNIKPNCESLWNLLRAKKECIKRIAVETEYIELCKNLSGLANDCQNEIAIKLNDPKKCTGLQIQIDDCITKIAIKNRDARICKEAISEVHCAGEFVKVFPEEKGEEILLKDEVTGWNIYRNLKYGFEFKYPPDFFKTGYFNIEEPTIIPIGCGCDKEQVVINGVPYCVWVSEDFAMGRTFEAHYYSPLQDKDCFVVSLMVEYYDCSRLLPDEEAYKKCEYKNTTTKKTLNQIVSTFRFFEVKKPEIEKPAEKPIEKIIFSSEKKVSESWKSGSQEIFYKYHIYSMNSDGTSLKKIFSYSPRTPSHSIIRKFGNDKIWIFRVNNDSDSKIIDTAGNEVTNLYAPVGENPVELYLSPDETKTLFLTGFDEISVYDLQSGELKKFSIDFGVPGEFGISHFVDQNHIMIGWGDIYAVAIGLVRLDFEKGFTEIKDKRNYSFLEGRLFYFNKEVIMGYENLTEGEQRIPPSILYTTNLNTGKKNIFYRDDTIVFEGYSISPDKKFIVFPAQPVFSDDITTLLIAEVDNLKKISVRKIDIPKMDSLLRIHWFPDNQKIVYFVPSTQKIIVIDILGGEVSSLESPEENINIIGVFKETK